MKLLRASAHLPPEVAPEFFNLLAHSPEVEEARVLEVNTTLQGIETFLIAIDGDHTGFAERAADTQGVESVQVTTTDRDQAYALLVLRPLETPLLDAIHEAGGHAGMVIRMPIVYRNGAMHGRAVGDPEPLQQGLDDAPDAVDVEIEEIGQFRGGLDDPESALSERQREALRVAHDLGYYDQPRGATHEDVAAEMGCAPPTASDHLQKAEAKLVDAVLDEFGPTI